MPEPLKYHQFDGALQILKRNEAHLLARTRQIRSDSRDLAGDGDLLALHRLADLAAVVSYDLGELIHPRCQWMIRNIGSQQLFFPAELSAPRDINRRRLKDQFLCHSGRIPEDRKLAHFRSPEMRSRITHEAVERFKQIKPRA